LSHPCERGLEETDPLLLRERRRLAGRPVDDDAVRAVVDEERAELAVAVVVDGAVRVERGNRGGKDLPEHAGILRRRGRGPSPVPPPSDYIKRPTSEIMPRMPKMTSASVTTSYANVCPSSPSPS